METQLASVLQSSQDPSVVANKVKGIILVASSFVILIAAAFFHVTLSPSDMVTFATDASITVGSIWTIYGCVLHFVTWLGTVKRTV